METIVKIVWDKPEEQLWLCTDNIKIALSAYCKNTNFDVQELSKQDYRKLKLIKLNKNYD